MTNPDQRVGGDKRHGRQDGRADIQIDGPAVRLIVFIDGKGYEGSFEDPSGTLLQSSGVGDWPTPGLPLDWLILNAAVNSTAELEEKDAKAESAKAAQ